MSGTASAATVDITVFGKSNPWTSNATLNPSLTYDQTGGTGPAMVTGLDFSVGRSITVEYLSGTTNIGGFYPDTTAAGGSYYNDPSRPTPANYTPNGPLLLGELIGAFADAQGMVINSPFVVGLGGSFKAPVGTSQLLLGINDAYFADNSGAYQIRVSDAVSAVPLPASAPMFGAALVALGAAGYAARRKTAAPAA